MTSSSTGGVLSPLESNRSESWTIVASSTGEQLCSSPATLVPASTAATADRMVQATSGCAFLFEAEGATATATAPVPSLPRDPGGARPGVRPRRACRSVRGTRSAGCALSRRGPASAQPGCVLAAGPMGAPFAQRCDPLVNSVC